MLILLLNNLNTGYADTDADLCFKIMSLWCYVYNRIIKHDDTGRPDLYQTRFHVIKWCKKKGEITKGILRVNIHKCNIITKLDTFFKGIELIVSCI